MEQADQVVLGVMGNEEVPTSGEQWVEQAVVAVRLEVAACLVAGTDLMVLHHHRPQQRVWMVPVCLAVCIPMGMHNWVLPM